MPKQKKRWIALDADYLVFTCTEGKNVKTCGFSPRGGSKLAKKAYKEPLKKYKQKFKALVQEVEDEISAFHVGQVKGTKVILSDSRSNFRYDIYPQYKGERPPRTELFYRLRSWAEKKYGFHDNVEADDVVAYYVREKNYIGASMDKDLWKGVPGDWFNTHYMSRNFVTTSPKQARDFNLIQTLMGDPTDNIKALPKIIGDKMIPVEGLPKGQRQPYKVTEKIAIELLDQHGWDDDGVLKIFESRGFGEVERTLNRRLIGMDQWHPKKGVTLWHPGKRRG